MIGTEVGNYRVIEKLGEGGMGVVYKAIDTTLDRSVAIKVLNADLSRVPDLVARFRSEAKAQANLNHTNLATLYAFLTVGGNSMMVMEFVDGETFSNMIHRRGPIPAETAVPMFRQALLGFAHAHRAGIIHRDIKPSNLMLNRQGIVKVMDFGIAKVMGERGLTRTGMPVGTCRYMSPEQVLTTDADARSDIYSLGITLYEMLTANAPFHRESEFQVMSDHVHTPPPPPSKFYPHIPKGVENAVLKALAKNPDERFQTVEEFGAALERPHDFGVAGAGVLAVPPPPSAARPTASRTVVAAATVPPPLPPPYRPPPQAQAPLYQAPPPARNPPAGLAVLFNTWPGRMVLGALGAVVLLMGGWLLFSPQPPRPLPGPIAAQVSPSQIVNPAPSPEQVDIEMKNAAAPFAVGAFEASPNPVGAGQRVTLRWSVPGATEVTISPAIGTVPAEGSRVIDARADAEFTLTAKAADGQTATRTLDILVAGDAAAKPAPAQKASAPTPTPTPRQPAQAPAAAPQQPAQAPAQTAPAPASQAPPVAPPQAPAPQTARLSPLMSVYHDHGVGGGKFLWPSCWGQLQIGGGRVVFHVLGSSDGRRDDFAVAASAVEEVRVNRFPIRGRAAFHMRINGQVFNFVPASGAPIQYVNAIEQWLQAK
ncbi:MAG: serine/threonine-protein kinase [Bryobacteraceae bacterium]|jgi:serine/threonine-protein kinase